MGWAARVLLSGFCAALLSASAFAGSPKLVSLDFCADQFALALADDEQIIALSPDAAEAFSFYRDRAAGKPTFDGSAEDILLMAPDLALRSYWGDARALDLIRRNGTEVVNATYGGTLDYIYDNLRGVGEAIGQPQRAASLVAAYERRLATLQSHEPNGLRAAYVTLSGFSSGQDTFVNEAIELAGFSTIARELGETGWGPIPLEAFVLNPPDVLIAGFYDLETAKRVGWSRSRHPRFGAMLDGIPAIYVPSRYLSCNGFFFIDAAEYIREEAIRLGLIAEGE